ncbi:pentapeptide repeat-containing protein [Labilibacter marinus]|uniref:pentapeptide repeat-containing protein n=1 Tax=Labilibacter marinus TaxID=1477105 RepID=UPI0009501DA8|nr:pentapeptide repeat-containing protein [Labilibacter marinus]
MNKYTSHVKYWIKYELLNYSSILFFVIIAILSLIFIAILDFKDSEFNWHDILVEAHGLIFDLFIFGLLITAFDFVRSRREKRQRYNEEIQDLIGWKSEEAKVKILAKVKRLYDLGQRRFFLSNSYLKSANLNDYDLTDSVIVLTNLKKSSFARSNLKNVQLTASKLNKVYFTSAKLENTDLSNSICNGAFFVDTNFVNTKFKRADLRKASFVGCNYENVNLENVKLDDAIVDDLSWFEKLQNSGAIGIDNLMTKYYVNSKSRKEEDGIATYFIERIKTSTQ